MTERKYEIRTHLNLDGIPVNEIRVNGLPYMHGKHVTDDVLVDGLLRISYPRGLLELINSLGKDHEIKTECKFKPD